MQERIQDCWIGGSNSERGVHFLSFASFFITSHSGSATDMLKGKGLIIHIVLVTYSILAALLKWRLDGKWRSIHFRQDVRKIDFFPIFSHKTSYTFQLLQFSDAMRPEDDSCRDKMKEMSPRSNF